MSHKPKLFFQTGAIVVVTDQLEPFCAAAVVSVFSHCQVSKDAPRRRSMPVMCVGRNQARIAGSQLADRLAFDLQPTHASHHVERLSDWMRMPSRVRARCKRHIGSTHSRRRRADEHFVLRYLAGEAV